MYFARNSPVKEVTGKVIKYHAGITLKDDKVSNAIHANTNVSTNLNVVSGSWLAMLKASIVPSQVAIKETRYAAIIQETPGSASIPKKENSRLWKKEIMMRENPSTKRLNKNPKRAERKLFNKPKLDD